MLGIRHGSPANASLLGNFEIVATAVVALCLFKEAVSLRLWTAIALITAACALLSFEGGESLRFSYGSLLVLLATVCWGAKTTGRRGAAGSSRHARKTPCPSAFACFLALPWRDASRTCRCSQPCAQSLHEYGAAYAPTRACPARRSREGRTDGSDEAA